MDFKTLEGAMEIFKSLNCIGNENCIFVTFKDTNREGLKYGALGAVGGAIAGAAASFSNGMLEGIQGFDGMLINLTEAGLAIIPLSQKGVKWTMNIEKMEPQLDRFVFVANENIESIIIKNFSFLNKKTKKVKIKLKDGMVLHQLARVAEKSIPYQEGNFSRFMDKCKNGKIESGVNNGQAVNNNQQVVNNSEQVNNNIRQEQNLINNNQEKEKFANMAINLLVSNNIISDYNGIGCEYGYLYLIEGHGYEGLFKIKKMDKIYYFKVQGTSIEMVNLDENLFELHKQSFLDMHKS